MPANATERAVRGQNRSPKLDGIYRVERRGESWRGRARAAEVGRELLQGGLGTEPGKETLVETRKAVERGWWEASKMLYAQGQQGLAKEVQQFVGRMQAARTDREMIADRLRTQHRGEPARRGPTR